MRILLTNQIFRFSLGFMSIDPRFSQTVQNLSIVAAVVGLLLGWVPGSDIVGLLLIWIVGVVMIAGEAGDKNASQHLLKISLIVIGAGFIFAAGVEVVTGLSLPIFFIVNPILDYIATYRVLRAAAKLYAKEDSEEIFNNIISSIFTMFKYIVLE
jgi:hypothetical protein